VLTGRPSATIQNPLVSAGTRHRIPVQRVPAPREIASIRTDTRTLPETSMTNKLIGTDTFSTTNKHNPDKYNLNAIQHERIKTIEFPALQPGQALVNLSTGELVEIFHPVQGGTELSQEELIAWHENDSYDEDDGDEQGRDFGGVIEHYHMNVRIMEAPSPNKHGEIPVTTERPEGDELTELKPEKFTEFVLMSNDSQPDPFLLLDRPEVTYEEASPYETYTVEGWYDPSEGAGARVKDPSDIASAFPDLTDAEYTEAELYTFFNTDENLPNDVVTEASFVGFSADDNTLATMDAKGDVHITEGMRYGQSHVEVECSQSESDDIKSNAFKAYWDGESWGINLSKEQLSKREIVGTLINTFAGEDVSVSLSETIAHEFGSVTKAVTFEDGSQPAVDSNQLIHRTLGNKDSLQISIPEHNLCSTVGDTDALYIEIDASSTLGIKKRNTTLTSTITEIQSDTIIVDCPSKHAEIVKSVDHEKADYDFDWDSKTWTVDIEAVPDLINAYIEQETRLAITTENIARLPVATQVSNKPDLDLPEQAHYQNDIFAWTTRSDSASLKTPDTCGLELTLDVIDTRIQKGIGSYSDSRIPACVAHNWIKSEPEEERHLVNWYEAETGSRVIVEEVEGWGTEYRLLMKDGDKHESAEPVVTLADERLVARTALDHLRALTHASEV